MISMTVKSCVCYARENKFEKECKNKKTIVYLQSALKESSLQRLFLFSLCYDI